MHRLSPFPCFQRLTEEAEAADAHATRMMADKHRELQEALVLAFDHKYER